MIEASLEKVVSGTAQVDRVGRTTEEVTAAVLRVSAMVTSITTGATQQLAHVDEANHLVGQLAVMAHQNAALAEESAAAAASLRHQAIHLSGLVHRFKMVDA